MIKRLFSTILLVLVFATSNAQETVLGAISKKIADMGCFKAIFAFSMPGSSSMDISLIGEMMVKGDKYILELDDMEIYSDGNTVWYYTPSRSEVIIEESAVEEGNILSTPASLLSISDRDFKIIDKGVSKIGVVEYGKITAIPRDSTINKYVISVEVLFDKDTLPKSILVNNRDDSYIDFKIQQISEIESLGDSLFMFDIKRAKEVIDFRGE